MDLSPYRLFCMLCGNLFCGIKCQLESAVGTGVVTQGCQSEADATGCVEDVLVEVALGTIDQRLTGFADAAAQNYNLGVHGAADHGKELTHILENLLQSFVCQIVAFLGGIKDILAGQGIDGTEFGVCIAGREELLSDADDAGGGAVLLSAATLAATAGIGLVTVQGDVADLAARAVDTVDHFTADDDAATNTGTQSSKDHVVAALTAALPGFAQRGYIGIIAGSNSQAGQTAQDLGDIDDTPTQVDTLVDSAFLVYRTGDTDADADDLILADLLAL